MGIRCRAIIATGLAGATLLPGVALGSGRGFELPDWMARMMDGAPPQMGRTMRSPEMQHMMRSPEMEQMMRDSGAQPMMEGPAGRDDGAPRDARDGDARADALSAAEAGLEKA